MATCGYYPTAIDPCLFIKKDKNNKPLAFVIIYVDDGGIIGTEEAIKEILEALSKSFKVKSLGPMEHFVGCHIIESSNKDAIWIHQPKLLKNLDKHFGNTVSSIGRIYPTPVTKIFGYKTIGWRSTPITRRSKEI